MLGKEQIERYKRHITIAEIGESGQRKLLDSTILIICDSIIDTAVMLYYISAMGISKISYQVKNSDGFEFVFQKAKGLNPDLQLQIIDIPTNNFDYTANYDAIVIFYEKTVPNLKINAAGIPLIFMAAEGCCGYLKVIKNKESINPVIDEINNFFNENKCCEHLPLFRNAYLGFIFTLAAIELVKVLLDIGSTFEQALQFNLAAYEFTYGKVKSKKSEYAIDLENARKQLNNAKVLIIGSGGLGSPNAYMLAVSGIGKLGLVDYDTVEASNLNRQILHSAGTIGVAKVRSAESFLKRLNPDIEICTYEQKFSLENAKKLIKEYDLVIDGLDNLPNRYLLNDTCYFLKKPLIEAGVSCFEGLTTTILPGKGPCYRCIFPETADSTASLRSETGILGAVPGVMGMLQAIEAIKHLTGVGVPLVNKILLFDALHTDFTLLDIEKAPKCALCGTDPTITEPKAYEFFCKDK